MKVKNNFLDAAFQVLLRRRLDDILLLVRLGAAKYATGSVSFFGLGGVDDNLLRLESKLFGVENANLNAVSIIVLSLIKEVVHILSPERFSDLRHDVVFLGQRKMWIFISLDLFLSEIDAVNHWNEDDLVAGNVFEAFHI